MMLMENHDLVRAMIFIMVFTVVVVVESLLPCRSGSKKTRGQRWPANFSLLLLGIIVLKLILPITLVQIAIVSKNNGIGLFNIFEVSLLSNIVITLLLFDLLIYVQHVLFHKLKIAWRIHRAHHSDLDYDASTGFRFHPVEILLSTALKMIGVMLLGADPLSVIIYEIALSSFAIFTHSNIYISENLERALGKIFITPYIHRIHHSVLYWQTDSNYGNIFSFWDRIFKTYTEVKRDAHINIGLEDFRDSKSQKLTSLLMLPMRQHDR